jgi:hypothetical protein
VRMPFGLVSIVYYLQYETTACMLDTGADLQRPPYQDLVNLPEDSLCVGHDAGWPTCILNFKKLYFHI